MIEEGERFGGQFTGPSFPNFENAAAIVHDGRSPSGDLINGLSEVRVETDIAIEGEGRGGDRTRRVAGMLFTVEERIIRSAPALSAGAEREFRRAAFRMLRGDLDLLHELSDGAFPGRSGWPLIGHGPAPGVALEKRSRGIFDRGRKQLGPVRRKDLDCAAAHPAMLMGSTSLRARASRGQVAKSKIR